MIEEMLVILITGPPASGKTHMANHLSSKFQFPVFSKDMFKEVLFNYLAVPNVEFFEKLNLASKDILNEIISTLLRNNHSFIIDNNYRQEDRNVVRALLHNKADSCIQVHLTANHETLIKRFIKREISPQRHEGHRGLEFIKKIEDSIKDGRYEVDFGYPRYTLNTNNFEDESYRKIEDWINLRFQ